MVDRGLVPPRGGALLHLPLRDAAGAVASCAVALRHIAGGSSSACIVRANLPPAVMESACIKLLRRLTHSQTGVQVRILQREGPPGLRGVPTARHHPGGSAEIGCIRDEIPQKLWASCLRNSKCVRPRRSKKRIQDIGPSSPRSLLWWSGLLAIFGLRGFLCSLALCVANGKALLDLFGRDGKQLEKEQCHQLPQPMPPLRFVKGRVAPKEIEVARGDETPEICEQFVIALNCPAGCGYQIRHRQKRPVKQ